jgi:hypothetical protein
METIHIMLDCTSCGSRASVPAAAVHLHVVATRDQIAGSYRYPCPTCGSYPIERASPAFAGVLTLADVPTTIGPRAPWEREAPPPTGDGLVEGVSLLRQLLDEPGWFDTFTEGYGRT